jgi:methanogenic corrinoid protein MtbC1
LYPAAAVDHLRRVARLLTRGHRPGEILGLSARELDSLLSLSEPATGTQAAALAAPAAPGDDSPARTITRLLRATAELDRQALMDELRAGWVRLGPPRFLEQVAGAFMVEVGRGWRAGTLEVRHEHFASACLSDFLRAAREPYDQQARGPRVVAALLPGEAHEGGLLIASTLMAMRGHRVLYLGSHAPVEQIAAAARAWDAEAVAVSVSAAMRRSRAARAIAELREALPRRVGLWVGGAGAPPATKGLERFDTLAALDARMGSVT